MENKDLNHSLRRYLLMSFHITSVKIPLVVKIGCQKGLI